MIKKIILAVIAILVLAAIGFVVWVISYPELSKSKTAGGLPRNQSQYLTMRDGVKIAVEVWLPPKLEQGDKVPTLIYATRYSRKGLATPLSFQYKLLLRRRGADPSASELHILQLTPEALWANEAGYAVVLVDARGSAASFGTRPMEWSPDEVADYGEIIAWASSQPWSNGKVGAWGTSYPGNTAELYLLNNPGGSWSRTNFDRHIFEYRRAFRQYLGVQQVVTSSLPRFIEKIRRVDDQHRRASIFSHRASF
jgi:putative CocE/NonD family hydrolase